MKNLCYLLFSFGIISSAIAIYQFTQGTILWGSLSILYSAIFFISGWLNYKKVKKIKLTKKHWAIVRTILFIVTGLMNTVFIRPEDIGTWKNYVGYGFLLLAVVDAFFLIKQCFKRDTNEK